MSPIAQLGWLVFVIAMIRRSRKKWPWITALVAVLGLVAWPSLDGFSVRLLLASGVEFGAVALLALQLLRSAAAMSENGQRLRRI
ncbi:hypothetical protein ACQP1G_23510 [Nocardia sp. CA-107356]|uniref:hypothetical protein n=1 Tax=Nocardia sp. CA-107356 TaxID=3239972 RepID=UPI003D8D93CC